MTCSIAKAFTLSRRDFLIVSGKASALAVVAPMAKLRRVEAASEENYYLANSERFMASFAETAKSASAYLTKTYGERTAQVVVAAASEEFERLLPGLTFIGGDRHPGTKWMLLAGHWIAFMRPMTAQGLSTEAVARMMVDLYVAQLHAMPRSQLEERGEAIFSQKYMDAMKGWAERSRSQRVDWVAEFVPGDGVGFDYGIDYHYCPCHAYFESQGAKAISPYFCLLDFPEHRLMGTGLLRTRTLAQGDEFCDFRYKRGRAVMQGWETEVGKFVQTG